MFITCIWAAVSPNIGSIRASCIVQGFGLAAGRWFVLSTFHITGQVLTQYPRLFSLVANTIEHLYLCVVVFSSLVPHELVVFCSVHERGSRSCMWVMVQHLVQIL